MAIVVSPMVRVKNEGGALLAGRVISGSKNWEGSVWPAKVSVEGKSPSERSTVLSLQVETDDGACISIASRLM
jgi:hypothetical protein